MHSQCAGGCNTAPGRHPQQRPPRADPSSPPPSAPQRTRASCRPGFGGAGCQRCPLGTYTNTTLTADLSRPCTPCPEGGNPSATGAVNVTACSGARGGPISCRPAALCAWGPAWPVAPATAWPASGVAAFHGQRFGPTSSHQPSCTKSCHQASAAPAKCTHSAMLCFQVIYVMNAPLHCQRLAILYWHSEPQPATQGISWILQESASSATTQRTRQATSSVSTVPTVSAPASWARAAPPSVSVSPAPPAKLVSRPTPLDSACNRAPNAECTGRTSLKVMVPPPFPCLLPLIRYPSLPAGARRAVVRSLQPRVLELRGQPPEPPAQLHGVQDRVDERRARGAAVGAREQPQLRVFVQT